MNICCKRQKMLTHESSLLVRLCDVPWMVPPAACTHQITTVTLRNNRQKHLKTTFAFLPIFTTWSENLSTRCNIRVKCVFVFCFFFLFSPGCCRMRSTPPARDGIEEIHLGSDGLRAFQTKVCVLSVISVWSPSGDLLAGFGSEMWKLEEASKKQRQTSLEKQIKMDPSSDLEWDTAKKDMLGWSKIKA